MQILFRDVPSFGLYMIIYEAFIRAVCGCEENASPWALVFCGGMAGELLKINSLTDEECFGCIY